MLPRTPAIAAAALALAVVGCRRSLPAVDCSAQRPAGPGMSVCVTPGWDDRDFVLHLPSAFDGRRPLPLVLALHGGGGRKETMNALTCEGGEEGHPTCLVTGAEARGMIVVVPDGTANGLGYRTWNAGGEGVGACNRACEDHVDDIGYLRALVDHVKKLVPVDEARVYVTGFSNGASMSHRAACEMSDVVAAIAPVSGANQFAFAGGACAPERAVPVLHMHGELDPCWPFAGGPGQCPFEPDGTYGDVASTMVGTAARPGWARVNRCQGDEPAREELPTVGDGTAAARERWSGCAADVELLRITGAGHTWPSGQQYLKAKTSGAVSHAVVGTDVVLDFLAKQKRN
jgi:polyhydroxybutyrate depolymerase